MKLLYKLTIYLSVIALPLIGKAQVVQPNTGSTGLLDLSRGQGIPGLAETIINLILLITGIIAVLFLIVGGFRYIISAGSTDQAESAKKTIFNSIIGLVVVLLSYTIVRVIFTTFT